MAKTKKTTQPTKVEVSPAMQVLQSYTMVNDRVYYKETSLNDLSEVKKEINYEIPLLKKHGISAILVDGKKRKEYLAPGIDPYQARKDLNEALEIEANKNFAAEKAESESKTSSVKVKKAISI